MKCVVTGDLHLHNYVSKINPKTNRSTKLEKILEGLTFITNYAIKNNIKYFVILGDIFHGKDVIHNVAFNIFLDFLKKYEEKLKFILIDGNHDLSGKNNIIFSALRGLKEIKNVIYFKKAHLENDVFYLPFSNNMKEQIKENSAKFLFGHFGLNEAVLSSGISIVSDIKASDLIGRYKYVILGHYHKPQDLINDQIRISYVGSPVQLDWGEKNEEKRFLVIDTDEEKIESIPVEYSEKYYEFEITNENKDELIHTAENLIAEGHKVKLVQKKEDFSDQITNENIILVDKTEKDITNRGMSLNASIHEQLSKYLEIKEIPKEKRDHYLKYGTKLVGG